MPEVSKATVERVRAKMREIGPATVREIADHIGLSVNAIRYAIAAMPDATFVGGENPRMPRIYEIAATPEAAQTLAPERTDDPKGYDDGLDELPDLRDSLVSLREELADLRTKLDSAQQGNRNLKEENNRLNRALNDQRQRRYDAEVKPSPTLDALDKAGATKIADLEARIAQAEKARDEAVRKLLDLQEGVAALERQLAATGDPDADELLRLAESERDEAKQNLDVAHFERDRLVQAYAALEEARDALSADRDRLIAEGDALRTELRLVRFDHDAYKSERDEAFARIETLLADQSRLQELLNQEQLTTNATARDCSSLQEELDSAKREYVELVRQTEDERAEYERKLDSEFTVANDFAKRLDSLKNLLNAISLIAAASNEPTAAGLAQDNLNRERALVAISLLSQNA